MPAAKVTTSIVDLSTRVSSTGTYNSAIVISAKKGPINTPTLVTSQTDFLRKFTPNERLELGWDGAYWEAYQYLKTQSNLYVVRAAHTKDLVPESGDPESKSYVKYGGCILATAASTSVENTTLTAGFADPDNFREDSQEGTTDFKDGELLLIYGADEGAYNNNISVMIKTDEDTTKLAGTFNIYVYNKETLVETWNVSVSQSLKNGYGVNVFAETILEGSQYIRAYVNPEYTTTTTLPKVQETLLYLGGGDDGCDQHEQQDKIAAVKTLKNVNDINIQLIMDGGCVSTAFKSELLDVCETREESCQAIISTLYQDETTSDALSAVKKYRKETLNFNDYSAEIYTPHQLIYDEFNDTNRYISPGPFVAASIMKYAAELGWHWAVAGYNRGIINSLDVAHKFQPTEVDELSDNQINTIIKDPGYGNVIWDELTMQTKASDMQDAHIVRYLNLYLRPRLKEALKPFLFEFNDDTTRQVIVKMLDTFMAPQQAARAVYEYLIVCDDTNNSDSDVENNILNVWLYVKPTKIAKFIRQKIIVTSYGTDLASLGE